MSGDDVVNAYFEWLYDIVCGNKKRLKKDSYRKLLMLLHETEFRVSLPMDSNRAEDGYALRYRFARGNADYGFIMECLDGPCSVLEMMVALAIRCEEHIMDDPDIGDRTGHWFFGMVENLGLKHMTDDRFDKSYSRERIDIFLDREYEPDGDGGLFTVRNCMYDLRCVEIWYQMNWYLATII